MFGRLTSKPGNRIWKIFVIFLFTLIIAALFWTIDRFVPAQHLPWKSLDTSRPLGRATKHQLFRLSLSPSATCMALARDSAGFKSQLAEPKRPKTGAGVGICGWDKARLVYGTEDVKFAPGESHMQCPLSVAAYIWQKEADKLAQKRFGQKIKTIHHMGTYSCRKQVGNSSGKWSEHAFANAWDVAAFELEDGRLIRVLTGWDGPRDEANFLRDVRAMSCGLFRVTLSPDFNAAHADHFHFDMGPGKACR